ncbi:MAG: SRPBCC domain-containing protein [Armatimonadetes bacterium]|nr:SRPBCC domain-containing protein [Armatimonadota bacterium]
MINIINSLVITLTLANTAVQPQQTQKVSDADQMLNLATATLPLVHFATVDAPLKDVWNAYTTTEGIKSWMVAEGTIDLKIGGLMRTSYTPGSKLNGPDVIENKIICFDPERLVSLQTVRTPESFPFKKAIAGVWTNLYFEAVGPKQTKVTCRTLGFDGSQESTSLRLFFNRGNQQELDELVKHFSKK